MLSTTQMTTLHSLMDRIIPPDEDPGAWEAGAGDYLLRQFDGDLRDSLDLYRAGLDALEAEAQATAQTGFSTLAAEAQDALLRRVEAGQVTTMWPVDAAQFFKTAVQHTTEGFYSDPGNGGNRNGIAWQMMGFVPGRPEEAAEDVRK
jgi:Gluconate 2-dehydrogenase subunit 3